MPHPSTCVNYLNHPHARRLPAGCPHARKSNPTAARNAVFRKSEGQRSLSNRNQWASTLSELAGSVTRCCRSKSEPSKHYIPTDSVTRCCRSKSEPSKHYIPTDSSQRSALHIHYIYIYIYIYISWLDVFKHLCQEYRPIYVSYCKALV